MSGQNIALVLEERKVQGKAVKQLRRDGMVPAVIHDHGKPSKVVMAPYLELYKVYKQAGKHHLLALSLGDENYMALIKDVHINPRKNRLDHVVFNAIKQDEKVETEVPVHIEGEIPAERIGLIIVRPLDAVQVEGLPKDLIDEIKIDGSTLAEVGDKIIVSDLTVPEGITILTEPEHAIAVVEEPRAHVEEVVEEELAEGEEGEAAEGEESEESEGGDADTKSEDSDKKE
ncbi:MAG TPA: 50S ribosomal protein L25 [Candidatus Saccharimonadales bacterium]|nr:50S ribosomal protein L25 [Candidatus Saccharimonadales bacterium]